MANLNKPVNIMNISSPGWYGIQYGIYRFYTSSSVNSYLHFKTNSNISQNDMVMIEAVGTCYRGPKPIRCAWTWYAWNNSLYAVSTKNLYTGLTAHGVYAASDGYVCIRAYAADLGDTGFHLNAYCVAGGNPGKPISISAVSQNATSGNYF